MTLRKLHFITGLTLAVFVGLHLFNHLCSVFGAEKHIEVMNTLRLVYRNIVIEIILLSAVLVQIFSGLTLFKNNRKLATSNFEKLHIYSGLYLAFFFLFHVSAVLVGRLYLDLDTNFYFGVAVVNIFPINLFFMPYYALSILAFFGHIAAIHHKKMYHIVLGFTPRAQAKMILVLGFCLMIIILYGLTNHFHGVTIPSEYDINIGK